MFISGYDIFSHLLVRYCLRKATHLLHSKISLLVIRLVPINCSDLRFLSIPELKIGVGRRVCTKLLKNPSCCLKLFCFKFMLKRESEFRALAVHVRYLYIGNTIPHIINLLTHSKRRNTRRTVEQEKRKLITDYGQGSAELYFHIIFLENKLFLWSPEKK